MKEEEIRDILKKHKLSYVEHATICGTIIANVGAYNNGIGSMMRTMKDHILHINSEGVTILAIDDMKGTVKEDTLTFIPKKNIEAINIGMKMFGFRLIIRTDKGEIVYKIRRSMLASPWHKENLSYLLLGSVR